MKIIVLAILFIVSVFTNSDAQNIVPNYSFEQADSCPVALNTNSYKYSLGCVGWGQATTGTADYYNTCDTAASSIGKSRPIVGIPDNMWGEQPALEGQAYAGFGVYVSGLPGYKEYLIREIPNLEIDTMYKVTIHVSLADSSRFAVDGIGVLFTTYGSPNQYSGSELAENPQVDYTSYGVVSDTVHWKTLSGTFVADSSYTTMIIGGFKDASEMSIVDVNAAHKINASASYYYIDGVVVEKLSSTNVNVYSTISEPKLFPNPFSEFSTLYFVNEEHQIYKLNVINMQGQVVQEIRNITTDRVTIVRNALPPGFYYYQLRSENGIAMNGKLIIR